MALFNKTKYVAIGMLLGIGFLFPILWIAGLVGAAFLIKELLAETSMKKALLGGGVAWFVKFLFVLGFYWSMYPIRWLPFDFGYGELGLIGLYWVTVAFFLGTGGAVFAGLLRIIKSTSLHKSYYKYLSIPLVWIVSEIIGSFMLSVFTLGPGSELNTHFSLGYIGLLVAEHPVFLQFARIAGVYSLSFIAVLLAVWLAQQKLNWPSVKAKMTVATLAVLWGSSLILYPVQDTASEKKSVAVVSTNFPVQELFNRESAPDFKSMQQESLQAAVETNADYIIFPEDSRIFDQRNDAKEDRRVFNFLNADSESIIVDSSRIEIGDSAILQGFIFNTKTNEDAFVHKRYLVPQGEFVPYIYEALFRLAGFGELMDSVTDLVSYRIGPDTSQAALINVYPGLLFCFESASATGVKSLIKERPDLPFIAHPVSHSWFNEPQSFWSQLDSALRVQAVWNQVAIVSAGNHAPSKLFLPNGTILSPEKVSYGEYWNVGIVTVPVR